MPNENRTDYVTSQIIKSHAPFYGLRGTDDFVQSGNADRARSTFYRNSGAASVSVSAKSSLVCDVNRLIRRERCVSQTMSPKRAFEPYRTLFVVCTCFLRLNTDCQLIINVRNQGGDVVQETISANATEDTVTLEFQRSDGTLVTQVIDFRNEVQILKSLILGEEERGQSQYQVMCFIFHFPKDSFISSDAMSKLRQKNPSTIRTPEDDLGRVNHTLDHSVVLKHSAVISPFIRDVCSEAGQASYTRYEDVLKWATVRGIPVASYQAALKRFPTTPDYVGTNDIEPRQPTYSISNCTDVKNIWTPCTCQLEQCIGWYPCELKYCKGKGHTKNSVTTYRCGIKTCKICHRFVYYVTEKQQCLWDE
ncbi:out at first protein [Cylas formicarius]|uniref:out at first protein n=1 Tax=Cylas formicarius TaxID=197179 RepID=UPI00295876CA|nr:out at first protein [Cylas formicarius]